MVSSSTPVIIRPSISSVLPHRLVSRSNSQGDLSISRSSALASPMVMRRKMSYICTVPARQGMHLPQDSSMQNSMKKRATSTMHEDSSMTIRPPEPMMEPMRASDS